MKNWELITCMLLHFRDRMNLKAPIYFSTGLTEKVLYSEMDLMYKLFGLSNICKISHGFLKVLDHSAIFFLRLWKMLCEDFQNINSKIVQTKSSNKLVQKELNVWCELALFSWLDYESLCCTVKRHGVS